MIYICLCLLLLYREQILRHVEGPEHLSYMISMVDLFATCAEVRAFMDYSNYLEKDRPELGDVNIAIE